jgi:hypothetical protein
MARQGSYTYENLNQVCKNRGLEFRDIHKNYSKRDYINVYCECSGERKVLVSGLDKSNFCCKRKSKLGENNPVYGVTKPITREWLSEIKDTCSKLCLCAVLSEKITAHARIRFSCPHGVIKETSVLRFVERKYCCKSQASKAHDPELKIKASKLAWGKSRDKMLQKSKERWERNGEREKHSKRCAEVILEKREAGWTNPGWGWKPNEENKNLPCTLYFIKYKDDDGLHYKIGITIQTLKERFRNQLVEVIDVYNSTFEKCFILEQQQLKYAKDNGWRYSSHSTTELIKPEGIPHLLEVFSALKSYTLT